MDEILVKGQDGKWYVLREEELLPYQEAKPQILKTQIAQMKEGPKGVTKEEHERLEEKAKPQIEKAQIAQISSVKSVLPTSVVQVSHEEHPLRIELEELVDKVMKEIEAKL